MFKWKRQNGKVIANRTWIMTEAWAVVNRFKKMGVKKPISEAMKLAWYQAKMEISVQQSVSLQQSDITELAKLGRNRLQEMANNINNIDRQNAADRKALADIQSAMFYA